MKFFLVFLMAIMLIACQGKTESDAYDTNTEVSNGEPCFVPLGDSWVIDKADVLEKKTVVSMDAILENLKRDHVVEVVVLIVNGVKNPTDYATKYGRWLKLGEKGQSTEGGNNGLVWLIMPDAKDKIAVSVGRGLPKFTSVDYGEIIDKAVEYFNFNNYDKGIEVLVVETDKKLRTGGK